MGNLAFFLNVCANNYRKTDSLDPQYRIKAVMIGVIGLGFVLERLSKLNSIYVD